MFLSLKELHTLSSLSVTILIIQSLKESSENERLIITRRSFSSQFN